MTPSVLSFHQRATRLLASDDPAGLDVLDVLITDGCAEALTAETEITRLRRQREAMLAQLNGDGAREALEMGERLELLEDRLDDVRDAISALMRRRSRQRLADFMSER